MTKRTDLAAPSVVDPAAFTFVAGVYFGSNSSEDFDALLGEWMAEKGTDGKAGWYSKRPQVRADFPALVPNSNFVRKGTCDHCGARFDWGSVYRHTSGGHIIVGNVCADKTMDVPSRLALDEKRMKSRIAAAREATRLAAKARAEAEQHGFAWLYSTNSHGNATLDDIARKGLAWGGLTYAQIGLVKRIHDGTPAEWEVKRAERDAARTAEEAAAQPVPVTDARVEIVGTVISAKEQDSDFGTVVKMLVRTEAGYKLWGAVPASLRDQFGGSGECAPFLRGKRIKFCARVQRSPNDDKFGFFSRPTKAQVVQVPA